MGDRIAKYGVILGMIYFGCSVLGTVIRWVIVVAVIVALLRLFPGLLTDIFVAWQESFNFMMDTYR